MRSIKLSEYESYSLLVLLRDDDTVSQYCVALNYNVNEPYGNQWDSGNYFWSFDNAMEYWNEEILGKKPIRQLEIYREDYTEQSWTEILNALDLNDDEVDGAFMVYASVIKSTLRESED